MQTPVMYIHLQKIILVEEPAALQEVLAAIISPGFLLLM